MNKETTCYFNGHRKIRESAIPMMIRKLKLEMEKLIQQGITTFISSGVIGFDTVAASMVVSLKELGYDHVKLVFVLPCRDQDRFWKQREKDFYRELLQEADEVIYISEKYHNNCMHERNLFLVNNSDYCICYLEKEDENVDSLGYALEKGLKVINLAGKQS